MFRFLSMLCAVLLIGSAPLYASQSLNLDLPDQQTCCSSSHCCDPSSCACEVHSHRDMGDLLWSAQTVNPHPSLSFVVHAEPVVCPKLHPPRVECHSGSGPPPRTARTFAADCVSVFLELSS